MAPTGQRERETEEIGIVCCFMFLCLCIVKHGNAKCVDVIFHVIISIARNSVMGSKRKLNNLYV